MSDFTWIPQPVYNISAPGVVLPSVASRANFKGYSVLANGTAGTLVLNDCQTLAQASAANQILGPVSFGNANSGTSAYTWPLLNGLVVSQLPTGMVIAVEYEILVL